jgi:hypothetical protein
MMPRPTLPLLSLVALLAAGPAAAVRAQSEAPARPSIPDAATLERMGLDVNPIVAETLGVRINPPLTAVVQVQRADDRVTMSLVDTSEPPAWSMRIHSLQSTLATPSPAGQIAQVMEAWRRDGRQFEVLGNEPVGFGGRPGRLCYLQAESLTGEKVILGWLILPFRGSELLVFSLQSTVEGFPAVRPLLEASFSTLVLKEPEQIVDVRKTRLDAGEAFLATLTPERLQSMVGERQWYRYYMPAAAVKATTDTELGYYVVEFSESTMDGIDPRRGLEPPQDAGGATGLLVHVGGHYIETTSDMTYDSDAYYWVAWDRSEEAWSIRATRRLRGREESEAVTGIRTPSSAGDPAGTITVINSGKNGATRDEQSWRVPEIYLSQAPRWALGRLLARSGLGSTEMSTYCFDTTAAKPSVSLRIDRWEPLAAGSNRWQLTSQARGDMPKVVSIFDRAGGLIRRTWATGQVSEPIELDALHALWRRKGLATGDIDR